MHTQNQIKNTLSNKTTFSELKHVKFIFYSEVAHLSFTSQRLTFMSPLFDPMKSRPLKPVFSYSDKKEEEETEEDAEQLLDDEDAPFQDDLDDLNYGSLSQR